MKYKIKYLIEREFVVMHNVYNINQYELNYNNEIEIEIMDTYFVNKYKYCKIELGEKNYMAISTDGLEEFKEYWAHHYYNIDYSKSEIKTIEEVIIKEIIG